MPDNSFDPTPLRCWGSMDKRRDNFLLALGIVPCLVISLAAFFVVPRFRIAFVAAGVPLPPITRAVFATFPYWGVTVLAAVVLWVLWPNVSSRDRVASSFGSVCAIALFFFGLWGCYAPILALAGTR